MNATSDRWPTLHEAREFILSGTGRGVRIAVLDSGIEITHPRLAGLKLADDIAVVEDGLGLKAVPGEGRDLFGHGTAVAGIIHQVTPEADIGSIRVLGQQLRSRTAIIAEGVRQALDRGYHILNCSFGCGRDDHVLMYKEWLDEAYLKGRHVVAACNNYDFTKREWPGHFTSVITVNFARSERLDMLQYRPGTLVEFVARGQDIEVAWLSNGTKQVSGSSFAAPHVAGLLARLISCCPSLSPPQAKALLRGLADEHLTTTQNHA